MAPKETSTPNIDRRSALRNALHRLVDVTEQSQELITQAWENLREEYHDYAIAEEEKEPPEYAEYFPIWTLSHLPHLKLRLILETVYGDHWKAEVTTNRNEAATRARSAERLGLRNYWELYLFFGPLVVKSRHCWSSLPENLDARDILAHLARNRDNRGPLTHYTVREFTAACRASGAPRPRLPRERSAREPSPETSRPSTMSPAATAASAVSSQPGGMGAGNSRPELSEMGDRGEDREGGSDEDISQYGDVSDAEQDVARKQRPKPASNQAEDDSGYHDGLSDVLGSDQDGNTEDGAEKAAEQGANDSAEDVVGTGAEESTDKARRRRRHPFVPPIIQECKDRGQYNGTLDSPSEATLIIMSVFNQDVIDPVIRAAMDQDSYAKAALHQKKSATDKMHALRAEGEALEKARWEAMMNKQTGPLDDAIAWTREAQEEMAQAARLPEVHMEMIGENRKRMLAQRGEEANEAKRLKLEKAAENARNALRVLANVAQEEMPSLGLGQD